MKNYDEMAESLFERRDEFNQIRKAKMKKVKIAVSTLSCFCLAVLLGVGVMYKDVPTSAPETTSKITAKEENVIKINKVDSIESAMAKHNIPDAKNTVMSYDEMLKTFLVDVVPDLPDDLLAREDNKGTAGAYAVTVDGEIDAFALFDYSNETLSRNVDLEVYKGDVLAETDIGNWCDEGSFEKSKIKNTDVYISADSNGWYFAKFSNGETHFRLITEGLTQDELISVIESLVD